MQSVIMIRIDGMMMLEEQEKYRKQLINQMQEGLFIVDDRVKEVVVSNINDLGLEFNIKESETNEKESI